jgi:aspartate beta-hydroxylase
MNLFYDRAVDTIRAIYDVRISAPPVLDMVTLFPGAAAFMRHWPDLRDEALRIADRIEAVPRFHEIMPEQAPISANDARDWRMFIAKAYGLDFAQNLAACPTLARLLREHPDVLSASISYLAPGKRVPPHRGPFRGILRYYLVLSMPCRPDGSPAAVLKVAGREHRLRDGESLLWDDTYEHEVWNDSERVRIVLLLDVWRRFMPLELRLLSCVLVLAVRVAIRLRGLR